MKNNSLYISRNYVEFGPFSATEVAGFHSRGIVGSHDYVRSTSHEQWVPVPVWLSDTPPAPEAVTVKKTQTRAKKPAAPRKTKAAA